MALKTFSCCTMKHGFIFRDVETMARFISVRSSALNTTSLDFVVSDKPSDWVYIYSNLNSWAETIFLNVTWGLVETLVSLSTGILLRYVLFYCCCVKNHLGFHQNPEVVTYFSGRCLYQCVMSGCNNLNWYEIVWTSNWLCVVKVPN